MNVVRAVFLDRDGVINENRECYIRTFDDFVYFASTPAAFQALAALGHPVVVVTNQSAIGRGLTTEETVRRIHAKLALDAASWGAPIASIEYCPHTPDAGCDCRKPAPGMFLRAAARHGIELTGSYLVGDSPTDIDAGARLGMVTLGIGPEFPAGAAVEPDHRVPDLLAAARRIAEIEGAERR